VNDQHSQDQPTIAVPAPRDESAANDAGFGAVVPGAQAVLWICLFSFREMVRRRRLISLSLIMTLPVLIVLGIRIWYEGPELSARMLLSSLSYEGYIPLLVPLVCLAVGASAIGEQVEEGTIVYYWTRPISRWAIYLGRLLAAQLVAATLLVFSLALCFVEMVWGKLEVITLGFLQLYFGVCVLFVVGAFVYTAAFAAIGTAVRRPMLPSILFAFGWESLVSEIPQRIQEYTIRFHLRNLIDTGQMTDQGLSGFFFDLISRILQREPVPKWQSALVLLVMLSATIGLGVWFLRRKEIFK